MMIVLFPFNETILTVFEHYITENADRIEDLFLFQLNETILTVFERFITENADRMEDLFLQMDKDKSGDITLEEFKYGLKDFGLRLTSVSAMQLSNATNH